MAEEEYRYHFPDTARIMIVSDDAEIANVWAFSLQQSRLAVSTCAMVVEEALALKSDFMPDLVVVDSHSYQEEDIEFCRAFREQTVIPLLLFTSQNDEYYLLMAYEAGVDEVVANPVSLRLFMAKVRAWLRRAQNIPTSVLEDLRVEGYVLNEARRLLILPSGKEVRLTHLEGRLLYIL